MKYFEYSHTNENGERIFIERYSTGRNKVKPVRCITTGETFESVKAASTALDIKAPSIGQVCRGNQKTVKGLRFEFI